MRTSSLRRAATLASLFAACAACTALAGLETIEYVDAPDARAGETGTELDGSSTAMRARRTRSSSTQMRAR